MTITSILNRIVRKLTESRIERKCTADEMRELIRKVPSMIRFASNGVCRLSGFADLGEAEEMRRFALATLSEHPKFVGARIQNNEIVIEFSV